MGFERLCMAMQNVTSNYDTMFYHLLKSRRNYRLKYTSNEVKMFPGQNKTNIAIRVIVDHVRAVAFAMDNCHQTRCRLCNRRTPCYTLRIYILDTKEPFIFELVSVLADQMGEFFQK
jgi:alanyl-tRNA synthetase